MLMVMYNPILEKHRYKCRGKHNELFYAFSSFSLGVTTKAVLSSVREA